MATGRIPINGTAAIQSTIVDAKGDLIVATGADAVARLAVGTNGHTLVADSVETTGLKWVAPAGGGTKAMTLLNAGGTNLTGAATVTVSGISGQQALLVIFDGASSASASALLGLRINTDTASNYRFIGVQPEAANNFQANGTDTAYYIGQMSSNAASTLTAGLLVWGTNSSSGFMPITCNGMGSPGGGSGQTGQITHGYYNAAAAVTSVSAFSYSGNFDAGKIFVYGMAA